MWAGYTWMITFGIFFGVLFAVMQWLTHGFILRFMRVKASRERGIMVKVRSQLGDYTTMGKLSEREVTFKKRHKKVQSSLNLPEDPETGKLVKPFYRCLGIYWCDVDEEKNAFCQADYTTVQGFDDERQEALIKRALYKPSPTGTREKIMLLVVIGGAALTLLNLYLTYQIYDLVKLLNVGVVG